MESYARNLENEGINSLFALAQLNDTDLNELGVRYACMYVYLYVCTYVYQFIHVK